MYTCPACLYEQNLAPGQRFCWKCRHPLDEAAVRAITSEAADPALSLPRAPLVPYPWAYPLAPHLRADTRRRGGCLTIYVVVFVALSLLSLGAVVFFGPQVQALLTLPSWEVALNLVDSALSLVCAVAVWKWKRWGVYGLVLLDVLGIFSAAVSRSGWSDFLINCGLLLTLLIAVSADWEKMD